MVALLALLPLASRATETTEAAKDPASEPQTYVLFTGTDLRVLHKDELHPVEDVEGSSLVIRIRENGKGFGIPLTGDAKRLVVERVQTLSRRSATVTKMRYERAYTEANDPHVKAIENMQIAVAVADRARMMHGQLIREPREIKVYKGGMKIEVEPNPLIPEMEQELESLQNISSGPLGSLGHHAGILAEEHGRELFDALEMEFELTSDTPLKAAYMIVVAEYHTKERPKDTETWVLAKSLGAIGSTPRKVWLREGGLPRGYVLENARVHLYEKGVEIATNLSENRASLTRDEAHEYLVLDYTSTHKSGTVPARLALTKLPADWTTRPQDESFSKTYFVKVDKDGRPLGAFEDEACTNEIANAYYGAVLRAQLFLPALEKGNPVDSVVRIKPSELSKLSL